MKKVLFITSLYIPHVGGVETMVRELSKHYINIGLQVSVLTKKWPMDLLEYECVDGVEINRVISAKSENDFLEIIDWLKINDEKIKADIIHVIGIRRPLPLIGLLLARKWKVPIINTIAGGDIPDIYDPNPGIIWNQGIEFIPEVLKQSDCVNAVSSYLANDLKNIIPELKDVSTLYAGIDFDEIGKVNEEKIKDKYIFSLRRLDPSKGIDLLIKSFDIIKKEFPDINLIIAGEGSEKENLLNLTKELSLESSVSFIGTVDLHKGISLLKGAVLTVVPSLSEGGGLVNVEAQAAGCPVVASDVGGIPEYLKDNYSGLLFKSGDVNDLADKIKSIIVDSNLRIKIIDGGYEYAKKFDWNNILPQYIDLYGSLIKNYNKEPLFKPWSDLSERLWIRLNS